MAAVDVTPERQTGLVPAGTWHLDPAHSSVDFQVKHVMIATVRGRFTEFEGVLVADEDGRVSVHGTIQAASIDTREARRDEHLRSPDFFDAAAYPQITFSSTEVVPAGGSRFRLTGELTIRGITKPVELDGNVEGTGRDPYGNERVALELRGEIDRKDFGLTWNQALETGGVLVGDRIKLEIDVSAVNAAARAAA